MLNVVESNHWFVFFLTALTRRLMRAITVSYKYITHCRSVYFYMICSSLQPHLAAYNSATSHRSKIVILCHSVLLCQAISSLTSKIMTMCYFVVRKKVTPHLTSLSVTMWFEVMEQFIFFVCMFGWRVKSQHNCCHYPLLHHGDLRYEQMK